MFQGWKNASNVPQAKLVQNRDVLATIVLLASTPMTKANQTAAGALRENLAIRALVIALIALSGNTTI